MPELKDPVLAAAASKHDEREKHAERQIDGKPDVREGERAIPTEKERELTTSQRQLGFSSMQESE